LYGYLLSHIVSRVFFGEQLRRYIDFQLCETTIHLSDSTESPHNSLLSFIC
jgi:hypothetical protein